VAKEYRQKARLLFNVSDITEYSRILQKEKIESEGAHWAKVPPRVMTLFQVLMDRDLSELSFSTGILSRVHTTGV
jgi:hypothetical protein